MIKKVYLYIEKLQSFNLKKILTYSKALKAIHKKSILFLPFLWITYIRAATKYGCTMEEYRIYKLWENRNRSDLFFLIDNVEFVKSVNDQSYIPILRDKRILLKRMKKDFLYRDFIDIENETCDNFTLFVKKNPKFVVKPVNEAGGRGIEIYDSLIENLNLEELYTKLKNEKRVLVEEYIQQHEEINKIYPSVLNSIRIHTIRVQNISEIILPVSIRFGSNTYSKISKAKTDFDGGITVEINLETGKLYKTGYHIEAEKTYLLEEHPDTKVIFENYTIPFMKELKMLVLKASKLVPELNFIGWDIAITPKGPIIIEGNGAPASYFPVQFLYYLRTGKGVKDIYNYYYNYIEKSKKLNTKTIEKINEFLFEKEEKEKKFDVIIVLGSQNCFYRVKKAIEICKKNLPKIIFFSGGNKIKLDGELTEAEYMNLIFKKEELSLKCKTYIEKSSCNTKENLLHVFNELDKNNTSTSASLGIISASFHLKRIKELISEIGSDYNNITLIPAEGPNTSRNNWFLNSKGRHIIISELEKIKYNF